MKHVTPLIHPLDVIVFDCDGTLSQIEGIDYLASQNGVAKTVHTLTGAAMAETGLSIHLYEERLNLVKPTRVQIEMLTEHYIENMTPDADTVIAIFKKLGKSVYIFSAGVNPSVKLFGEKCGVPSENIFAIDLAFDAKGNYVDFDRHSLLIKQAGKQVLIDQIKKKHRRIGFVGDGMNDVAAMHCVDRFVGYGGAFYREKIKNLCDIYLTDKSFMPLLSLFLTEKERSC